MSSRGLIVAGYTLGALVSFRRAGFGLVSTLCGLAIVFAGLVLVTREPRNPRG